MLLSASLMAALGLLFTFLPEEVLSYFFDADASLQLSLLIQLLGSLYFAFAMLNWMAKANLIGGIYSRPVAVANLTHFFVGGMALTKSAWTQQNPVIYLAAGIYLVMGILFAIVVSTHPVITTGKSA